MAKQKHSMEEMFQRELSGMEIRPSPHVWKKISSRLAGNDFVRFSPSSFNIYFAAALLLAGIAGLIILSRETEVPPDEKALPETEESILSAPIPPESLSADKDTFSTPVIIPQERPVSDPVPGLAVHQGKTSDKDINEQKTEMKDDKIKTTDFQDSAVFPVTGFISPEIPSALFEAIPREGCAPLKVRFRNYSENTSTYAWSFGDGGTSAQREPAYIFDEPGTYFVSLTSLGKENMPATYTGTITVHAQPEVRFEPDLPPGNENGQPVYFYNYTRGAERYFWDFGDGHFSDEKDPVHHYDGKGNYHIKLVAVTAEGCKDSLTIKDALRAEDPVIKFPTAFSPNTGGTVGGYYSGRESNNDVFFPYISELPVEYLLRIFNRNGNLVFESSDIQIGWDGYYRQELQPAGVYVWKVRARFADGRTVVQAGDVSLIRR